MENTEEKKNIFYFRKEKGGAFLENPAGETILSFSKTRRSKVSWVYPVAGFFAAVLNYYVFAMLYLLFRFYNMTYLSFFFGLSAIFGSVFIFWLFLRNFSLMNSFSAADAKGEMVYSALRHGLFFILNAHFRLFSPSGSAEGFLSLSGFFSKKIFIYDSSGEALFRVSHIKGGYVFYGVSGLAVGFAKKSSTGTYSIDLSRDLNGLISEKLCAAAMYLAV